MTGVVGAGQVAYAPGPLRVASLSVALGAAAQPGTAVLAATSARPVVSAALPVSEEYLVHRGDRVTVTLPDGSTTARGVVTAISQVASSGSAGAGSASSGSAGAAGEPSPGPSSGWRGRAGRKQSGERQQ